MRQKAWEVVRDDNGDIKKLEYVDINTIRRTSPFSKSGSYYVQLVDGCIVQEFREEQILITCELDLEML